MDAERILESLFPHAQILSGIFGKGGQGGLLNNLVQAPQGLVQSIAPGGVPGVVQSIAPGGVPGIIQSLPMPQQMRPQPQYNPYYYDSSYYSYGYDPYAAYGGQGGYGPMPYQPYGLVPQYPY
jgi:hypothetical protein